MPHNHWQDPLASSSSSSFQSIINAALKSYEQQTKKDLLAHPLAAQLQSCDSPSDILTVLQDQAHEFGRSQSANGTQSRWLISTVNVLYAFSATLGEGVGLVSLVSCTSTIHSLIDSLSGILASQSNIYWLWRPPLGQYHLTPGYWHSDPSFLGSKRYFW